MNTIITLGAIKAISPIFLLTFVIIGGYFVIKYKKLKQALFALSLIGSIACLVEGAELLSRHYETPSVAGAILIATGLGVMVSIGIALQKPEDNK